MFATEAGKLIKEKKLGSVELTQRYIDKINRLDGTIGAYITVNAEDALEKAAAVQKRIDAGETLSPLAGVPIAVKDIICTKGIKTTCASKVLENFVPPYNATVVDRLEQAGMIVLGKTNMDEFAMGSTTETSALALTKNPWNTERVPGGSSGGSAAAVAADEAIVALGTDTGGSIRQPSSFCGITGIKPTYGAVSRYGVVAYASSLDQVGTMGHSAEDCAAVLSVISGHDAKDSTSMNLPPLDFSDCTVRELKGMKIGIPSDYFDDALDGEVRTSILQAVDTLKSLGAEVSEFKMSMLEYAIPTYYIISCAEASSNLSRYDGVKYSTRAKQYDDLQSMYKLTRSETFGEEAKRRIMLGSFLLSSGYYDAFYLKALKSKNLIKQAFDRAFEQYDLILGPVAPTTANKMGTSLQDPLKMYLSDIYTVSVNLAGLPGMSVPCGFDTAGMPIGFQLIGKAFGEKAIVKAATAYQSVTDYHKAMPAIAKEG